MSSYLVSSSVVWDSRIGKFVTSKTWESFDNYPDPATIDEGDTYDIQQSLSDGKYTTTYRVNSLETGQYNFQVQSTLSTEPLTTHPLFAAGGIHELNDEDLATIRQAESDGNWTTSDFTDPTGQPNLYAYAQLAIQGIESYLNPSITLHMTKDEGSLPDLTQIGKVVSLAAVQNLPTLPTGSNWLLAGVQSEALGDTGNWRNSYEYRASGIRGWNATLYGTGT